MRDLEVMNETTITTLGERMARIEGAVEHLATRADLAAVNGSLTAEIAAVNATIGTAAWGLGVVFVVGSLILACLQVYFGLKNRPA